MSLCLSLRRASLSALHRLQTRHPCCVVLRLSPEYSCPFWQCDFDFWRSPFAAPPSARPPLKKSLSFESISSGPSPLSYRETMVSVFTPTSLATSQASLRSLPIVTIKLHSLLMACSRFVAQRQFSLQYPLLLSIRSSVYSLLGLAPTSDMKLSKLRIHSSHTDIPRPPYLEYDGCDLFKHRCFIDCQVA